eukprot:COSAG04_NODE_19_length_39217_cov_21.535968_22_plen_479_part_00
MPEPPSEDPAQRLQQLREKQEQIRRLKSRAQAAGAGSPSRSVKKIVKANTALSAFRGAKGAFSAAHGAQEARRTQLGQKALLQPEPEPEPDPDGPPAPAAPPRTDTAKSRRRTKGALLSGLRSGALQQAVAKMEEESAGAGQEVSPAPAPIPAPASAPASALNSQRPTTKRTPTGDGSPPRQGSDPSPSPRTPDRLPSVPSVRTITLPSTGQENPLPSAFGFELGPLCEVSAVEPGSPAGAFGGGLQIGDQIQTVDGTPVYVADDVARLLALVLPHARVELRLGSFAEQPNPFCEPSAQELERRWQKRPKGGGCGCGGVPKDQWMARQRRRAEMDYDTKVKAALQRAAAMYQRRRQQQQLQERQEQLHEQPWEVQQEHGQDGEEDIEHLLRLAKEEVRSRISEHQQPESQPQRLGKPEVRRRVRSHIQTLGDPDAADINDARIDEVFERFDLDGSGGISEEECEGLVRHLLSNTRLSF